jgi:hypothetical protein
MADATLNAVQALGNDASAEQIRQYLAEHFGIQVRPNHLGMALQRHRRAGRLQEVDGLWSVVQAGARVQSTDQTNAQSQSDEVSGVE